MKDTFICRITQASHEICDYIIMTLKNKFPNDYDFYKHFNPKTGDYEIRVKSNFEIVDHTLSVMRGEKEYK